MLFGGGSASALGARSFTKADLPKLAQLMLQKTYLGRELRLCLQKQDTHSLFNASETVSFAVGLFTGVATLDVGSALKAARATSAALDSGSDVPCKAEMQLTMQQLAQHDATAAELGLPKDVTYEQVQAIVMQLGGLTDDVFKQGDDNTWDNCVKAHGLARCTSIWKTPGHTAIPAHDPKTGLAIR